MVMHGYQVLLRMPLCRSKLTNRYPVTALSIYTRTLLGGMSPPSCDKPDSVYCAAALSSLASASSLVHTQHMGGAWSSDARGQGHECNDDIFEISRAYSQLPATPSDSIARIANSQQLPATASAFSQLPATPGDFPAGGLAGVDGSWLNALGVGGN